MVLIGIHENRDEEFHSAEFTKLDLLRKEKERQD
jgi:hypothetical protein